MSEITIQTITGAQISSYIPVLAQLRIKIFAEFPYLYDGSIAYEKKYLRTYANSDEVLIVLANDKDKVVGASTALPLRNETQEVNRPFIQQGYDLENIFYFGESVLDKSYRGRGIGGRFFDERERHARNSGYSICTFCAVERPENHSQRPAGYKPLFKFWKKRGYERYPALNTTFSWKDMGDEHESEKLMTFWLKTL